MKKTTWVIIGLILSFNIDSYCMNADNEVILSLPDLKWALKINLEDYTLKENTLNADLSVRKYAATNEKTGLMISIFLENNTDYANANDYRNFQWNYIKSKRYSLTDTLNYEKNMFSMNQFTIKEYNNNIINHRNLHAFYVKGDYCIDIHLSKINFKNEDEKLFTQIINSIAFIEPFTYTSMDYFLEGSIFYMDAKYTQSIKLYSKALTLEKNNQSLEKKYYYVLIDNLAMSYGITGNISDAIQILQYGISIDKEYPMFYFNLACAYAEKNDIDNTVVNLESALMCRKNMLEGEILPNPKEDDSFKKFLKNDKFKKVANKY